MHAGVVFSVTRFQFAGVGDYGSVRRTKDEAKLAQRLQMRSKAGACCGAAYKAQVVSNPHFPRRSFNELLHVYPAFGFFVIAQTIGL